MGHGGAELQLPSKSQIRKAGQCCRDFTNRTRVVTTEELVDAFSVIATFRAAHAQPLQKVTVNLRYYVEKHTESPPVVGQRLKRFPTILEKLGRESTMALDRMTDIGGCRAVVGTNDEVAAIVEDIRSQSRWSIRGERNYIETPNPRTGYRGHHLYVRKDDREIEVQLRTASQHRWAEYVETVDRNNPGLGLKAGLASDEILEYFRLGADIVEALSLGLNLLTEGPTDRFEALHAQLKERLGLP